MKKLIVIFLTAVLAAMSIFATPAVTDVVAKQRYPWNGQVDITCKVTGIDGTTNGLYFSVAAVMPDTGGTLKDSHFWVVQDGTNSTDREVRANGDYRLLWDARAGLGQVNYSNMVVRVTLAVHDRAPHDKVQLWEGGPYWATMNVGAENPWDYGYFFWWGDTVGYKRENGAWVASDGSSSNFQFGGDPMSRQTEFKGIATLQSEGWITADGYLAPEHDAAQVQWGGGWRMPTLEELEILCYSCDWIWTTTNGVNGYIVRGRGDYTTASIFLPSAGFGGTDCSGSDGAGYSGPGGAGQYWLSGPPSDDFICGAWGLVFFPGDYIYSAFHRPEHFDRYDGFSVRPVQGFIK